MPIELLETRTLFSGSALIATTTTLVDSKSMIAAGSAVTFTAAVVPETDTGISPTGTVAFISDGNVLASVAVESNGTAMLRTAALPAGRDAITASYNGDADFGPSTSAIITETVTPGSAPTTISLNASAVSVQVGGPVNFTVKVASTTAGDAAPTGTVSFIQDGNLLGTETVDGDGAAALATTSLPAGADHITATYNGDAHYAASTSVTLIETVSPPAALVPTIVKSTFPTVLVAGVAAHGSVVLNITNSSSTPVKGRITIELFASTTGSVDTTAISLTRIVRATNVKTAKSLVISLGVKLASTELPAGAYTLLARVVDSAGAFSDSVAGPGLSVAVPVVLLSESIEKSAIAASAMAGAKAHISVTLQITNNGNIITPGKTTVALYASLSGAIDANTVQLLSVTKPLRIQPNKSILTGLSIKKVPAIAPGTYTILAQVTDPNGELSSVAAGSIAIS